MAIQETDKEATLRDVLAQCETLLYRQHTTLDELFDRNPKPEGEPRSPTPTHTNVLDEIIDRLIILRERQETLLKFMREQIIPKI